jgi:hypothetical protein
MKVHARALRTRSGLTQIVLAPLESRRLETSSVTRRELTKIDVREPTVSPPQVGCLSLSGAYRRDLKGILQ